MTYQQRGNAQLTPTQAAKLRQCCQISGWFNVGAIGSPGTLAVLARKGYLMESPAKGDHSAIGYRVNAQGRAWFATDEKRGESA